MKNIITISRQFGSGGREIGRRLAKELGYHYYDQALVSELAKRTDMAEYYLMRVDEIDPQPVMPMTVAQSFTQTIDPISEMNHEIYHEQAKLIEDLAEKGNCVFVGRAADYVLRDKFPLRLFIVADDDFRLKRCHERGDVSAKQTDKQLLKEIRAIDKRRGRYYEFYTGQAWGEATNYDLIINTSQLGIDQVIKLLADFIR